jgi:hypothetical protein
MPTSWIPSSSTYTLHSPSLTFQQQIPQNQNQISWPITTAQLYPPHSYPQSPTYSQPFQAYWLRQAEKCFTLVETPIHKRVKFAEVFLMGKADHWLQSTSLNTSNMTWCEFAAHISTRFAAETSLELIDSFCHVNQSDTLNDYIDTFEEII